MRQPISTDWTEDEIIEYFREAAVERSKCGFNAVTGNRILDNKLVPSYQALVARGSTAVRKLLRLTSDENPHVRLEAASFAYDADPEVCRRTLQQLMRKRQPVGVQALVILLHRDGEFAAEFERLVQLGRDRLHEELARRYGGYLE